MTRRLIAAALICGSLSATPLWAEDPKNTKAADAASAAVIRARATPFLIGPEDILDIQVWKNVELSRTVPVRPDGKVSLPLVNDIQAAGLTPIELRDQLTTRLAEFIPSPEVSVSVKEVHSVKVTVMGMVRIPGRYEVKSPATVLELIGQAQGLTDFANRNNIVVIHQDGTRVPFNYRKATSGSDIDNFFVRAGDIIYVN